MDLKLCELLNAGDNQVAALGPEENVMNADESDDGEVVLMPEDEEREAGGGEPSVSSLRMRGGGSPTRTPVRARILWPALGFPAVITPRTPPSRNPMLEDDATRCVCVLVLSDRPYLSKEEAARYLRFVPWNERGRRHILPRKPGSFAEEELAIHNDGKERKLVLPPRESRPPKDKNCVEDKASPLGELIHFGGNRDGENAITVNLAHYVRNFYRDRGLKYLHEIRVSEEASGRLVQGLYHLFWNNEKAEEKAASDEMSFLLREFARPRREKLGELWEKHGAYLLEEYEYEYGALHPPYAKKLGMRRPRAEVLHPIFVERRPITDLKIGHITDSHVDVRADVYEENLKQAKEKGSYNNWNRSFAEVYEAAKHGSNIILLTGDLIDYGRGHWGIPSRDRLGDDTAYHVDRNWFLFHYLLAKDETYTRPVYTILGNHDWRLNPYPPFAVAGAPGANRVFNDHAKLNFETPKSPPANEQMRRQQQELIATQKKVREELDRLLRVAHGPGHERLFSYSLEADSYFEGFKQDPAQMAKALLDLILQKKTMDVKGFPAETTVDSVAWYLLAVNPFLDYGFALPGGHQFLMLDWSEDENVLFPIVEGGKERPYGVWEAGTASGPGPKARNCLSSTQQQLVSDFAGRSGKAKVIGIHAPPIGPFPDWHDDELVRGRKTYDDVRKARGPTNYATRRADGSLERWNGHPFFGVTPKSGRTGAEATYNSFENCRDWFIRLLAEPAAGVRMVLSGHIHRNGLYIVHTPGKERGVIGGEMLVRGVVEQAVRGVRHPAGSKTPEGGQGPLYINTTSAGPRGNWHPLKDVSYTADPGYALIELSIDGTIGQVQFRKPPRVQVVLPPVFRSESEPDTVALVESVGEGAECVCPGCGARFRDEGELSQTEILASSGSWPGEEEGEGAEVYAQVLEEETLPHTNGDRFARLLTGDNERFPSDQMLLPPPANDNPWAAGIPSQIFSDVPAEVSQPQPVLVEHRQIRARCSAAGLVRDSDSTVMATADMNPGFIGADDEIQIDPKLAEALTELMVSKYRSMLARPSVANRKATKDDRIRVALVDLTGDKLCKPGYAGWGSTVAVSGASTAKIALFYAAAQLVFDIRHLAKTKGSATGAELLREAGESLKSFTCRPDLRWVFTLDEKASAVNATASTAMAQMMLDIVQERRSTPNASELIMRLGFEYIASVLWQSGLRHPTRGGLWIGSTYCTGRTAAPHNARCHVFRDCPKPLAGRFGWKADPLHVGGIFLNALSAGTFFTLLAQGRLVAPAQSKAIEDFLAMACTWFGLALPGAKVRAAKCGLTGNLLHDAGLIENGGRRYAVAYLTQGANAALRDNKDKLLMELIRDLDGLIAANNP